MYLSTSYLVHGYRFRTMLALDCHHVMTGDSWTSKVGTSFFLGLSRFVECLEI